MDAQFPTFDDCEQVFLVGFNTKENVVAGKNVSSRSNQKPGKSYRSENYRPNYSNS